ncbi:hypothetical protein N665_0101s0020 [Sinapis alba]|nr:hypothetical protein N665_0101s0020 [Sinapis alba]
MRCDNYCPKCREPDETITHAIFEYPPALQVWSLSSIPSNPNIFPLPSIYANIDSLFWRGNIMDGELSDRDHYPWLIWYIWKTRNDKLFRRIDTNPMELVHFVESECQAWFNANERSAYTPQQHSVEDSEAISLDNICMVDGSWTSDAHFNGCGWVWKDNTGKTQVLGMRNLRCRETAIHSEVESL